MHPSRIKMVAAIYAAELRLFGFKPECRRPASELGHGAPHCLWMLEEIPKFVDQDKDKAMRWLCFAQGVLWVNNYFSIDDMRKHNDVDRCVDCGADIILGKQMSEMFCVSCRVGRERA